MNLVLYRKYRPTSLAEIVGQPAIIETLTAALKKGSLGHALLFTGPRGIGKTSLARIIAHEINKKDYTLEQTPPMDIIEIDAASSGRIDEIRDLREKVALMPLELAYKVYIIDEVHMLTKEAFNALLKTLEEPPQHIIFILATTEVHKVPATIISRCQRFTFKAIKTQVLADYLLKIAKLEKIKIDEAAAQILAEHSQGSLRDGLSLLEQIGSLKQKIDLELVESVLGLPPQKTIQKLLTALLENNLTETVKLYQELLDQGVDTIMLTMDLNKGLRKTLLKEKDQVQKVRILDILKDLLAVFSSPQPQTILEITLLRHTQPLLSSKKG